VQKAATFIDGQIKKFFRNTMNFFSVSTNFASDRLQLQEYLNIR